MDIMKELKQRASADKKIIVFPEGHNPVIQRAAALLKRECLAEPILLGSRERTPEINDLCMIDPGTDENSSLYISSYCEERQMPEAVGKRIIMQPLCYAAMMVKTGRAIGMVAGIDHPTEEVIMASELIYGLNDGVSVPSSFYLVEIPGYDGPQGDLLIFSDPSMNPDPTPEALADIAWSTAMSAGSIFGCEARVALLSFSTKGSAEHPRVTKVQSACTLLAQKNCQFLFDGELQLDAAINPVVGLKKTGGTSPVAGKANVLIFPDLDSCNISSKLVQHIADARLYGPILQGFRYPVSDLSRGASVEDVVGSALLIAALG